MAVPGSQYNRWFATNINNMLVDQKTNMTLTAYMVIARLHNVSHCLSNVNGLSMVTPSMRTDVDGVSKMYRSNRWGGIFKLRDLLPLTSASVFDGLSNRLLSRCHLVTASAQFRELSMYWLDDRSMDVYNCVLSAYWWRNTLNVEIRRQTGVVNTKTRGVQDSSRWTAVADRNVAGAAS